MKNTIKLMMKDFIHYGYTFNSFIEFKYPICKCINKDELKQLWKLCISEMEAL